VNISTVSITSTPKVINLSGRFLIPGLIDTHQHISNSPEKCLSNALLNGITALKDMGGDGAYLTELQEAVKRGELLAPDIYLSALMGGPELILKDTCVKLSSPEEYDLGSAPWMRLVDDTCDIVQIVIDARSFGVSGIKMYSHLSKNVVYKLAQEAHRQGLQDWSHSFVSPGTVADVVNADVEAISHVPALLYRDDWNLKKDGSLAMDGSILGSDRLDRILDMMK